MKVLVVAPDYPNENKVAYNFIHERIKQYKKEIDVDVFSYNNAKKNVYVYESVKVFEGGKKDLSKLIKKSNYDKFVFHFLNLKNGYFILRYLKNEKVYIWFHGTDSVSYKRRLSRINYNRIKLINPFFLLKTCIFIFSNKVKLSIIKKINKKCKDVTFVFVSKWNKCISEKDLKIKFKNVVIIHNFINTEKYKFKEKKPNDRFKVLVINNFNNMIYGGDLLQKIIVGFSKEKEFRKFQFSIFGDGKLFDKYTKKLKKYKNVKIKKGYLKTDEIVREHNQHGVFLYPKRGDSQGVSRCEAMSSGLVPIASRVEAVEEFTPSESAYLVNNIADEFIAAFKSIYNNPMEFVKKSKIASQRIREQCSCEKTINKEIDLLRA